MMKKRSLLILAMLGLFGVSLFSGCGAGGAGDTPAPAPGTSSAATVDLLVSSQQLNSDVVGAPTVTLTAIVKDSSNKAMAGETVSFNANSGLLTVASATTDANGRATAILGTGGNPTNRTINVIASSGAVSGTNTVAVTGTTIAISGSPSLSFGGTTQLTISLRDSTGRGINNQLITVTSQAGNTLTAASFVTNVSGQIIVTVAGVVPGADTITATAIGATNTFALTVNASSLIFIAPAVTDLAIGAAQTVTVEYRIGGAVTVGAIVNFTTTRGALSSATAVTGADGRATVTVTSASVGPAILGASIAAGPSAQLPATFVATTPNTIALQATPVTISTNPIGTTAQQSLITAVVRDASANLVKNQTVIFSLDSDGSGGTLSPVSAVTDSNGAASTFFIAGASASALNGVVVRGTVSGTAIAGTVALTVANTISITLGTGPFISAPTGILYQKSYVALVTNSVGAPVAGKAVEAKIRINYYRKGAYSLGPGGVAPWFQVPTLVAGTSTLPAVPACLNEDAILHDIRFDYNGILDPGEDQNGNGVLDPGIVVSATATLTDAAGFSTITLTYAKNYASWVNITLTADTNTAGEAKASATFDLPGLAADYANATSNPPGNPSPFGISATCFDVN